jgi:hypothetical protein
VHVIVIVDAIYSEVIWKVDGLYDGWFSMPVHLAFSICMV